MGAFNSKYHIGIDSKGYVLDRGGKAIYAYQKKIAPAFVNKFGSGDSSYRDANFWQFWAQINWRNGAKQEKWGDGGKFWKSSDVDVSQLEQLKLSKLLVSAGQAEAGAKITCQAAWRTSQNWWDANYGYRKQLTITAPSAITIPTNYPVKVDIDTAALQTASKVRSDRNDWRIVYWNGTNWVDLPRDYVDATNTFFATQSAIAPGTTDTNYYLYYGYSGESTNKQPTTDADWNAIYYPKVDDTYVLGLWHFKDRSGNTIVDTDSTYNLTLIAGSAPWVAGDQGGALTLNGNYFRTSEAVELTVGSFTLQWRMKANSLANYSQLFFSNSATSDSTQYVIKYHSDGKIMMEKWVGGGSETKTSTVAIIPDTTNYYNYAVTYDGANTVKIYRNNILLDTLSFSGSGMRGNTTSYLEVGSTSSTNVNIQHLRYDNVIRTSFTGADVSLLTSSAGSETTTQPPASSFTLYVGTDTGRVYTWDGTTTFTLAKDFNILVDDGLTTNVNKRVGDTAGTEYKQAQSIQIAKTVNLKSLKLRMKATATAPTGVVTIRIETDTANAPSGTLVDAGATTTIPNFTGTDYADIIATFTNSFVLTAATKYWIVISCAAQANDVGWDVSANTTSIYADGSQSQYNGSWTNNATHDLNFVLYTNPTSVNCAYITSVGGQKLLFGTGKLDSQINGDALLWGYDGSAWSIVYVFKTSTESQVTSMTDFSSKLYVGVGPQARVYETADLSTFTLSKDIDFPQKPGYVYSLKEYNSQLIASGGSPEFLPTKNYGGFAFVYNGTLWQSLYPFDHTVIKSAEFYDAFLFFGTYHGQMYTYNTSYLDPLFSYKDDYNYLQQVSCQKYFDDKLFIGLYPQTESNDANIGLWCFERHGMSMLNSMPVGVTGLTTLEQVNNILMIGTGDNGYVYKQDPSQYVATGWMQTSYYDANLPSIPKLWNQLIINHDPLVNGHTIQVYYRFKEADAWVELVANPIAVVDSTSTLYPFPNQVSSNKISFKIVLSTTNSTSTPVIRETVMRYTLFPVVKYMWNLRIKCKSPMKLADGTVDARTGEQMREELETLIENPGLHTFVDIDGTSHTVLFHTLDEGTFVIDQEESSGSTLPISLIEV